MSEQKRATKATVFFLSGMFVLCAFCIVLPLTVPADLWRLYPWRKVELDLTQMDENGLRGPRYGKVSVSYEFCVPNIENYKAEVKAIDRTVQITSGYSGRIGAGKHECLCVGYTRKDYRDVLMRLAELSYIKRIIECHFE